MTKLDSETLTEAWLLYKETDLGYTSSLGYNSKFNETCRNRLMLHYTSLVRFVVVKRAGHLPQHVDREDLVSYGMFGLLDAIEKYDPTLGDFEHYAPRRIWGAVRDALRKLDWVPRGVYAKGREIEDAREALEQRLGRPPEHQEVAQALGQTLQEYWATLSDSVPTSVGSTEGVFDLSDPEGYRPTAILDPTSNLEQSVEVGEIAELLAEGVGNMDVRSKTVLVLYYFHDMTLADIGALLGVTESRVCQLQGKALTALSASLGQAGLAA